MYSAPDLGGGQSGARAPDSNRRKSQILEFFINFFFLVTYRGTNIILCTGRHNL